MVQVSSKQHYFIFQLAIMAGNDANHIAGVPLPGAAAKPELTGDILDIAAMITGRLYAHLAQLRSQVDGRYQFIGSDAATSSQSVVCQKGQFAMDVVGKDVMRGCILRKKRVRKQQYCR